METANRMADLSPEQGIIHFAIFAAMFATLAFLFIRFPSQVKDWTERNCFQFSWHRYTNTVDTVRLAGWIFAVCCCTQLVGMAMAIVKVVSSQ